MLYNIGLISVIHQKAVETHSSTLAWKIPWMEEPGRLQSMGSLRAGYDWATSLSLFLSCIGEGNGNPLQCSCLENPRDGGTWWAAVFGVAQSWTRLKRLSSSSIHQHELTIDIPMSLSSWNSHPPSALSYSSSLIQNPVWVLWGTQQIFIGSLFYLCYVHTSMLLSPFIIILFSF